MSPPPANIECMFDDTEAVRSRETDRGPDYPVAMTVQAHDVAAALRARVAGVPTKKLHKLLYYCQGHHLAATRQPLFVESLAAWDMGPVVGKLWYAEKNGQVAEPVALRSEAVLNTIGYVVSRYAQLTGRDLELLSHAEMPWRRADENRDPGGSARIEREWLLEWFSSESAEEESELDSGTASRWLAEAQVPPRSDWKVDDVAGLHKLLTDAR
jgi:uncharacterized phage-associated protein